MSPWECIYYRPGGGCVCWQLSGIKPCCPYYDHGGCTCGGRIGRQGVLSSQKPVFVSPPPAPTLMRFRA
jgi:hypothetical protein